MLQVVFRDLFFTSTGWGSAARGIAFAMEDLGVDVKLDIIGPHGGNLEPAIVDRLQRMEQKPLQSERVLITLDVDYPNKGQYLKTISCTMFETTKAPASYVKGINQQDGLIAPNEFNRQSFREAGVTVPIQVAQYGVDPVQFTPNGPRDRLGEADDTFVFLSVFGWSDRKGPDVLVRAFLEEFTADDPVALIIKTYRAANGDFPMEWYDQLASGVPKARPPKVRIISVETTPDQMANLYRGADCFVLPTRGEGVGLPILESMACGVPVITTGWSAHTDFFGPSSGYVIPYRLDRAHPLWYTDLYQPDQLWAEPDSGALQALMRRAYTFREEAKAKGQHGRSVAEQWTWRHSGAQFIQAIEAIVGRPIR